MAETKQDPFSLRGKHAIVTGASRGIGAAIAATLARLGADLTLMSRNEAQLREQATTLQADFGAKVEVVPLDVAEPERIAAAFAEAAARLGPARILVNNAGIAAAAPIGRTELKDWQHLMQVNAAAPFLCIRAVLPGMAKADYGRIVNIASTAGLTGYAYCAAYCAAKHALVGLTRALARELARTAVTVNAVCPGYTDTDIVAQAVGNIVAKTGRSQEDALRELTVHNPQGRLIRPEEVAETVGWLCAPSSGSITGQSILVDGGELM
jgi:NAD(P)-dependent dehydrogenase (short-subunit alcohol dehydrogenase family)